MCFAMIVYLFMFDETKQAFRRLCLRLSWAQEPQQQQQQQDKQLEEDEEQQQQQQQQGPSTAVLKVGHHL